MTVVPPANDEDPRPQIVRDAVAALDQFVADRDQAARLLPMWSHAADLTPAQTAEILSHFPHGDQQPGKFARATAAIVRAEIARAGWTEASVVDSVELAGGAVSPLRPDLGDRLACRGALDLADLQAVAVVLGEDATAFARRVILAAQR